MEVFITTASRTCGTSDMQRVGRAMMTRYVCRSRGDPTSTGRRKEIRERLAPARHRELPSIDWEGQRDRMSRAAPASTMVDLRERQRPKRRRGVWRRCRTAGPGMERRANSVAPAGTTTPRIPGLDRRAGMVVPSETANGQSKRKHRPPSRRLGRPAWQRNAFAGSDDSPRGPR